jgi:transposase
MRSIFRKRNPDVEALFQRAGRAEKVMCVAFDYAKKTHTAVVCDGEGKQLRSVFNVQNDRAGIDFLLEVVAGLCRKHSINQRHVFFGGEDCGSYAFNFIHALVSRGFLVVGVNTKQAKEERESSMASTDLIDTIGVAGMMIKMRGRTIGQAAQLVHGLKRLRRQRGAVLKAHSASAHRTHRIVDELFPGFLDCECSGISPFSRASLWLMGERFSAAEVHARRRPALTRSLRELGVQDPDGAVEKLRALAESALPPSEAMIPALQRSLIEELNIYRLLEASLHGLDTDIAKLLARTPGAILTTIPGISLRWAAGLYAELGDPIRRRNVHRMASLGGVSPGLKQSGGPDKPPVIGHRSKACCTFLKHALFGGAASIAQYGHPEMREAYEADKALRRDAHTRLAQKLLRICLHLMDHQVFFLPPSLHQGGDRERVRAYYALTWRKVLIKWRDSGAILDAVAEGAPLRAWRDMAQELYGLELDLRSPQTGRK